MPGDRDRLAGMEFMRGLDPPAVNDDSALVEQQLDARAAECVELLDEKLVQPAAGIRGGDLKISSDSTVVSLFRARPFQGKIDEELWVERRIGVGHGAPNLDYLLFLSYAV